MTLPFDLTLVLGGGNALGGYQAGVFQRLGEAGIEPDRIVATSVGAINGAIVAGNAPEDRIERLRAFWRGDAGWTWPVGFVRAEFLRIRNLEYVRAAKALGMSDWRVMTKHIMPNAIVTTLTYLPFTLAGSVTSLTALDFLGLGLPAGSPSLGELLNQGKNNLQAPWLGISGFVVTGGMLILLVFIGEGIRDAFDPRKTRV